MASWSRKRDREEPPDLFLNPDHNNTKKNKSVLDHQEAQAQPSELNADNPQLLPTKPELTPPKDPERKMKKKKERKSEGAEMNISPAAHPQACAIPDSTPPKDTDLSNKTRIKQSVPKREGAEVNDVDAKHELEPLPPKDSDPLLVAEPEPATPKEPNQKKRKRWRKKKNKGVLNGEGVESNRPDSEHPQLCHKPELTAPKGPDGALLSEEPKTLDEPDQKKKKRRRKKKNKCVLNGEEVESNRPNGEQPQLCHNPEPTPAKGPDGELLPETEPIAPKEPDQKKKKRRKKKKNKNVLSDEGVESNRANAENPQLSLNVDPLPAKDSDPTRLPKPQPAQKKDKNVLNGEGANSNRSNAESSELVTKCNPLPPIEPAQKKTQETKKRAHNRERYTRCSGCKRLYDGKLCTSTKCLSQNVQEICFFCGNVGHRLGKCPKSPGAKFAICSLCDERGHFSENCPQNSQGIHPEVTPAFEPIKTGAKFSICSLCNEHGHFSKNCPQNSLGIYLEVAPAFKPIKTADLPPNPRHS